MFNDALYEMEIGLFSCVLQLYNTQEASSFIPDNMSLDFGRWFRACHEALNAPEMYIPGCNTRGW